MRSIMLAAALGGLFALATGGCKKNDEDTIRFMYWGDLKEIQIIDELMARFKRENPGVKIENQRVAAGGPQYDEKLTTLFAGKQEPEVFLVSSYYASKYAQYKAIADLTELSKQSKVLGIKDFYPEIIKEFTEGGRLYVIPRDIAPVACLYYNKSAFKEAGLPFPDNKLSWPQDFAKISQKLVKMYKNGKGVQRWGYVDDWDLSDMFIYSAGGKYVDDPYKPTRVTLDSPAAMEGIQFRADLMHLYKSMPSGSAMNQVGAIGSAEMFKQGNVAMFYSGSWQIPNFRDITDFDWDIALPPMHSRTKKRAYSGGGSGYAISARAEGKKRENAWKLVEFMTRPEASAKFASSGLLQPANRKVAAGPGFIDGQTPKNKKILLTAVKDCYVQPRDQTRWREIMSSGLVQAMESVFRGEKKAVEAMPEAVKAVNDKFFPAAK
jgi:ABC-type glycerol-3-phosphate transport system substrate-binding protein